MYRVQMYLNRLYKSQYMNWVSHFEWSYWVNITSTTLITATLALLPNELMVETGVLIRRSGTFEFLTPLIIIDDVSIEPDLKINKKCLRNINAPMVQNSKGLHIYIYAWVIKALVATIVTSLVLIKQMVHIILSGQRWNRETRTLTLTSWPKKSIGIIFSLKSTSVASLVTINQRVTRYKVDNT